MDLVTILQSLPSRANLCKLEKFLELAISTKVFIVIFLMNKLCICFYFGYLKIVRFKKNTKRSV